MTLIALTSRRLNPYLYQKIKILFRGIKKEEGSQRLNDHKGCCSLKIRTKTTPIQKTKRAPPNGPTIYELSLSQIRG